MPIWNFFKLLVSQVTGFLKIVLNKIWSALRAIFRKLNKAILTIFWLGITFVLVIAGCLLYYLYLDLYFNPEKAPNVKPYIEFHAPVTGVIRDTNGEAIIELAKESQYRKVVAYDQIPPIVRRAILSAEDERFFSWHHHGIDYRAITRAITYNLSSTIAKSIERGELVIVRSEGASTLTQQTYRLWFLSEVTKLEKSGSLIATNILTNSLSSFIDVETINSFTRKLMEVRGSIWLNGQMAEIYGSKIEGKKQDFVRFANYTYFGNGRYGVEAACEYYFGYSCQKLTSQDADKAALLAAIIKSPAVYGPRQSQSDKASNRQIERRNRVLRQMYGNDYIKYSQLESLTKKPLEIVFYKDQTIAPSVVGDTLKEANSSHGLSSDDVYGGYVQLNLTVDLRIQKIANEACEKGLQEYEQRHPESKGLVQCAAVVLRNGDGAILAEVGGRQWYKGRRYRYFDLNRVNRARQAGSAFKPFVYLTAFMNGWTPEKMISDSPIGIPMGYGRGSHPIHNYDGKFLGSIPVCEALYRSRNAPTVRLVLSIGKGSFEESGMKKVIDTAKLLGVKSPFHSALDHKGRTVYYPTSALGASEINVLELANAYREIASGLSAEPHIIRRIITRNGEIIFEKTNNIKPSEIDKPALEMVESCLRKVITTPGGTAYSLTVEKFPVPIAGKTGTTDDFRNALFAGFTHGPNGVTVVARIDFDDNSQLAPKETGSKAALPIVKYIFHKVYEQNLVGPAPKFPEAIENR